MMLALTCLILTILTKFSENMLFEIINARRRRIFFTGVFCFAIFWPGLAKIKAKWILAGVIFTGVGNINPEFTGVRTLGYLRMDFHRGPETQLEIHRGGI